MEARLVYSKRTLTKMGHTPHTQQSQLSSRNFTLHEERDKNRQDENTGRDERQLDKYDRMASGATRKTAVIAAVGPRPMKSAIRMVF
jgi:hypothetical protein